MHTRTHSDSRTRPSLRHTHTCVPSNRWGRIQRCIYTQMNTNTVYFRGEAQHQNLWRNQYSSSERESFLILGVTGSGSAEQGKPSRKILNPWGGKRSDVALHTPHLQLWPMIDRCQNNHCTRIFQWRFWNSVYVMVPSSLMAFIHTSGCVHAKTNIILPLFAFHSSLDRTSL